MKNDNKLRDEKNVKVKTTTTKVTDKIIIFIFDIISCNFFFLLILTTRRVIKYHIRNTYSFILLFLFNLLWLILFTLLNNVL